MRPFFFVRMGCLGWLLVGWLVVVLYVTALFVVVSVATLLWLTAAVGAGADWALRSTIDSYRARRENSRLHWPAQASESASAMLVGFLGGNRTRHATRAAVPPRAPITAPAAPAAWYGDPHDVAQLRYWDGLRWTEHTAPAIPPPSP